MRDWDDFKWSCITIAGMAAFIIVPWVLFSFILSLIIW